MPFTVPNLVDAAFASQAGVDSRDFDILASAYGMTGVVSGCGVTGSGLATVAVAAGVIRSAGQKVSYAGGTVTISNGHATLPRITLVSMTTAGALVATDGTPVAITSTTEPACPAVPAGNVALAMVYVPATVNLTAANQVTDKRVLIASPPMELVTWYGMVAGSTAAATANVTAWAACLAALPAAGGSVYIPAGVYYVNGTCFVSQSNVQVIGETGAVLRATLNIGDVILFVGIPNSSTVITNVKVIGLEIDGNGYACDISNAAPVPGTTDSRFGGGTYFRTATSGSTTTAVVSTATWQTNAYAGYTIYVASGTGSLQSSVISSNTGTTITFATLGVALAASSVFWVVSQEIQDATWQGAAWGMTGIVGRNLYGAWFQNCSIHDTVMTGIEVQKSGQVFIQNNRFDHNGVRRGWNKADNFINNPITCYRAPDDSTYPGRGWIISGNIIRRNAGVAIDLHGYGGTEMVCANNIIYEADAIVGQSGAWGISVEEEAEAFDNAWLNLVGNFIADQNFGFGIFSPGSNGFPSSTSLPRHINISGNNVENCLTAVLLDGRSVTITGNQFSCARGIDTSLNGTGTGVALIKGDWSITGNTFDITGNLPALYLKAAAGVSISGVTFESNVCAGNRGAGALHDGVHLEVVSGGNVREVLISNNSMIDFTNGLSTTDPGMSIGTATAMTASGVSPIVVTTVANTTIASASNGQSLPQATITVASTTGYPASGVIQVTTASGIQIVSYTGVGGGGTTFTGCLGGSGVMSTGGAVGTVRPAVGEYVVITGAVGETAANGTWKIQAVTTTTMTLANSTGNGTWSSGGAISIYNLAGITVRDNRIGSPTAYGYVMAGGPHIDIESGEVYSPGTGAFNGSTAAVVRSIRNVVGFNDTLLTSTPTPTTGVYTITANRDAWYWMAAGTVSAVTIGGTATSKTTGDFWVPAGQQLAVTNTVIPTTFRQTLY